MPVSKVPTPFAISEKYFITGFISILKMPSHQHDEGYYYNI